MADQNSQYMAILTAVGEAKLANSQALGLPWLITQLGVGDANGSEPVPNRNQTTLINERRRAQLNQLSVDPNNSAIIIAEQVIPENVGGWWIREVGLYDADNDLVAVANCPPTFKPELSQGSGRTQVVRLNILVSSTQNITLKIDPSVVLATRAYVDNLLNVHAAAANPHPQYQLRGAVTTLSQSAAITPAHLGLLLLDAAGGARTFTLPPANAAIGVNEYTLRRVDVTGNQLTIAAAGTDKIVLSGAQAGQASTELLFAGDYLQLRSDGAGKWWCVGQAQLPGSLSRGLQVITTVGVSSYTVPPVLRSGRVRPLITVVGAGGSGGVKRLASEGGGGGGGGGGIAIGIFDLTGVSSVPVTIGAGGLGLIAPGNGNPGGASSFGTYCSATGGNAGGGGTTAGVPVSGGLGGVGTGGQINQSFGQGSYGHVVAGGNAVGGIGGGGGSPGAVAGTVVPAYGNGSGGVGTSGASYTGDGGQGVIKIEW